MTTKNSSVMQRNNNLTALRGIFILMIVLHHLDLYDGGGSLAVALFFMLGGFALSMGYYDKVIRSDFSYISFIKRRIEKFFPLHWLCLLAILPLSIYSIVKGTGGLMSMVSFIPNALLLQSLIPVKSVYFSFNAVSWYLSDTMILALLFPFIVKGLNRISQNGKILGFILILLSYSLLVYLLPIEFRHAILYINPIVRVLDFIVGIYLFLLVRIISEKRIDTTMIQNNWSIFISLLMVIIAIATSCLASENSVLIAAIYWIPLAILLVNSALLPVCVCVGGGKIYYWLIWIGEISFPIFLTHQIVIRYVRIICVFIGLHNTMVPIIISIPVIILVSWLCDKYFLRTVSLWLKGKRQ